MKKSRHQAIDLLAVEKSIAVIKFLIERPRSRVIQNAAATIGGVFMTPSRNTAVEPCLLQRRADKALVRRGDFTTEAGNSGARRSSPSVAMSAV